MTRVLLALSGALMALAIWTVLADRGTIRVVTVEEPAAECPEPLPCPACAPYVVAAPCPTCPTSSSYSEWSSEGVHYWLPTGWRPIYDVPEEPVADEPRWVAEGDEFIGDDADASVGGEE